jgi:hypothetical protein
VVDPASVVIPDFQLCINFRESSNVDSALSIPLFACKSIQGDCYIQAKRL